jgi:hypothetical protein
MAEATKRGRGAVLRSVVVDGSTLIGGGLLSFGAWAAWPPAGWMVAGVLLLALGLAGARRG